VYDLDEMGAAAARIAAGLPRPHALYYSLKANPNPAVVGAMLDAGCRAEVSSPSELAVVLGELAGPDPDRVLYTGPGKAGALAAAIAAGCRWFSVESTTELAALEAAAGESGVEVSAVIRLNVAAPPTGARLPISGGASKFGVDVEDALALAATAPASPSVTVAGLQFFQGGNVAPAALGALLVDEVRIAAAFRDRVDVRLLDLGGGFAAPYGRPGSADAPPPVQPIEAVLDECFAGWRGGRPLVAFESGRALVGSGGVLACRVTDVKHSGGRRFVLVDSGIHHLGGMFGLRRLVRPELQVLDALQRPPAGRATVAGPLCTPLDTWGEQDLPDVAVGDLLLVRGVGAYGLSASLLGFVSQDPALEVAARQGEIVSARRVGVVGEEVRRPVVG
jgi:diaminopimelate decarboxylase